MEMQKTRHYQPTDIRAALLEFAELVRATGSDGADWAERFIGALPAVPCPKIGDIFSAATAARPQADFDLKFEFRAGVHWTLRADNLSVTLGALYPFSDPGQLWIAEWVGETCDLVVESPDWVYTLWPYEGPERICEDLTGYHFACADWSETEFFRCIFDTPDAPRNLSDGGASFVECWGPDGEEWGW
jgi:hypothetical protein